MSKISGVYCIKNTNNNRCYIGSSIDVNKRLLNHKSMLRKEKHPVRELQFEWSVYGESTFEMFLLEQSEVRNLPVLENEYIMEYDALISGYNKVNSTARYENNHVRKTHYFDKTLYKKLNKYCRENNLNKSYVINEALKILFYYIENNTGKGE